MSRSKQVFQGFAQDPVTPPVLRMRYIDVTYCLSGLYNKGNVLHVYTYLMLNLTTVLCQVPSLRSKLQLKNLKCDNILPGRRYCTHHGTVTDGSGHEDNCSSLRIYGKSYRNIM
jgi:hypothetical protein